MTALTVVPKPIPHEGHKNPIKGCGIACKIMNKKKVLHTVYHNDGVPCVTETLEMKKIENYKALIKT